MDCFVKKLKGVVNNNNLLKVGYDKLVIQNPTSVVNIAFKTISDMGGRTLYAKIKSDHTFTDGLHTAQLGKEVSFNTGNTTTTLYFNGDENSPAIVEIGPVNLLNAIFNYYVITDESYGYDNVDSTTAILNIDTSIVAGIMPKIRVVNAGTRGLSGNIAGFADCDELIVLNLNANNSVIGNFEDLLVAKWNRPTAVQRSGVPAKAIFAFTPTINGATFNGVHYSQELYCAFSETSPYLTVKTGGASGTTIGTWDGTSWSYT